MADVDEDRFHLEVELAGKRYVASDVLVIDLVPVGGSALPAWSPGAHVDLVVAGTVRQYSLCGRPDDLKSYRLAIRVDPGGRGGSLAVADLDVGAKIQISLPRNHFELIDAPDYLFVAGGIGITPIISMIEETERRGASWRLVYGGRSRETMAFANDLVMAHPARVELWSDDVDGPIDVEGILAGLAAETVVYCCGPEPLLAAVTSAMGVMSRLRLHLERFRPKELAVSQDREFVVKLQRDGRMLRVPADRTLMEVLLEAGVDVMFSCTEGTCGTCETRVVAGRVEHRDSILTPAEQESDEYMMVCVSRALEDELVIDR